MKGSLMALKMGMKLQDDLYNLDHGHMGMVAENRMSTNIKFFTPNVSSSSKKLDMAIRLTENNEFEESKKFFRELIDDNEFDAYYCFGQFYEIDESINPYSDFEYSEFYYNKAMELAGSLDAALALAILYFSGKLDRLEYETANELCGLLLSEHFTDEGFVYWLLARSHYYGLGVQTSFEKTIEYSIQGWKEGHIPCLGLLGAALMKSGSFLKGICFRLGSLPLIIYYTIFNSNSPRIKMLLPQKKLREPSK